MEVAFLWISKLKALMTNFKSFFKSNEKDSKKRKKLIFKECFENLPFKHLRLSANLKSHELHENSLET